MQVSFIVPLFNCLAYTQECLRSLQATLPPDLVYEIILVDDGSTDGTREWLATPPARCRAILNESNLGFAGACNRGAAAAGGILFFFLNNDLILQPGWFEPMSSLLLQRADAGLVGNVQLDATTRAIDHAGVRFTRHCKPAHDVRRPLFVRILGTRQVPAITGACFGIRRDIWQSLGGFDEGFVNGGEDIDLCLRARASGQSNFVTLRSVVLHRISASPGRKLRDEANSLRLARRWRDTLIRLSARLFCAQSLQPHWLDPRAENAVQVSEVVVFWAGLSTTPPEPVLICANAAMDLEFARWHELLDE
jgi:O-antigen biosynthesis protein